MEEKLCCLQENYLRAMDKKPAKLDEVTLARFSVFDALVSAATFVRN